MFRVCASPAVCDLECGANFRGAQQAPRMLNLALCEKERGEEGGERIRRTYICVIWLGGCEKRRQKGEWRRREKHYLVNDTRVGALTWAAMTKLCIFSAQVSGFEQDFKRV